MPMRLFPSISSIPFWPLFMADFAERRTRKDVDRAPEEERRHSSNGGPSEMLPLWLQAVKTLGTTGAIAVFLVWVGSNELPKIAQQTEVNAQAIIKIQEQIRQQVELNAAIFRMMQRLCANTAKSDDDRTRCFEK